MSVPHPAYETYPVEPPPSFVPAPFWRRLLARLIDFAIAVPITFVTILPVILVTFPLAFFLDDDAYGGFGAFLCFLVAYALIEYFLLRRRSGQTLGKGLLGLRVIPAGVALQAADRGTVPYAVKKDGRASAISGLSALLRMLVVTGPFLLAIALLFVTGGEDREDTPLADVVLYLWWASLAVSTLTVLLDRGGRRGLHDMAARTRVVRTERRSIDVRADLRMLVPGRVSLEKESPTVTLWKDDPR